MNRPTSYFDRIIANPRHPWLKAVFILLLFGVPLATGYAEGSLKALYEGGGWRGIFLPPVVIAYILLVSPGMARMEKEVLRAFRSLVIMEDNSFEQLANRVGNLKPKMEIFIFSIGALLGLLITYNMLDKPASFSWLILEWFLLSALEYGLLASIIYASVAGTRLTAAMLRQPLRADPFDTSPFEPIGRQSLLLAFVFVGGIVLSLLFIGISIEILRLPAFWLVYLPILAIPVVIFFLSMSPTHKVLAAAKRRELKAVQAHFDRSCRELLQRIEQGKDASRLSARINALEAYSRRLQTARTWPYNTSMLRTLIFSVLIPGGTALARILFDL